MKILKLVQGSPGWHAHRATSDNASDAPAMMGASKHVSRTKLLEAKATGRAEEVTPHLQALFDRGHRAEAAIRPVIEKLIGDDLFPVTGVSDEDPRLSASFDGVTLDGDTILEVKLWNEELVATIESGQPLDMHYVWQVQQQLLISRAARCYFVTAKEDGSDYRHVVMEPDATKQDALIAGWKQFRKDLADYVHEAPAAEVVAEAVMSLPSVSVVVNGGLTIVSNLAIFGERLKSFIENLNPNPSDDQAFANAENEIKVLKKAEDALDAAEASALAQVACVDELRQLKGLLYDMARNTRLGREKLVKARKDQVRVEIQQAATKAIGDHVAEINARMGKPYMPSIAFSVAEAMKGKKTVSSLKDAAATEVARVKIEADRIAKIIDANLATLREKAKDHAFLFSDTGSLVLKDPEAVAAIVDQRITAHEVAEAAKAEAAAEAARERIRKEEQAKAQADVEAKAKKEREDAAAEQKRLDDIERQQSETKRAEANAAHMAGAVVAEVDEPLPSVVPSLIDDQVREIEQAATPITKPAARSRPTDDQIIEVLALHFRTHESKVIEWLLDIDLDAASNRMAKAI